MSHASWRPYQATSDAPWNWRRVVHLHRRAGFAATWSEVERDLADGHRLSLDRLLQGRARSYGLREDFEEMSRVLGAAAVRSNDPNRLKAWWLYRMLFGPDPLKEKLTLLWHNHFATSNLKVRHLGLMKEQNEVFRKLAAAKFGELLRAVVQGPAMLLWLDADSNRKGRPNENLARELMELFTLGIGHYTEADVKEAARALTGWTVARERFRVKADRHDTGEKTLLGKSGKLRGEDVLALVLAHPATSRRLAWRICDAFFGEGVVSEAALEELAAGLRAQQLDVGWGVSTVLRSELFFADRNMTARVSSPVELVVGAVRALELLEQPPSTLILAQWCGRLGQDLFYPPNVGGWSGGRSWLTSRSIVARANFAAALVAGELQAPATPLELRQLAGRYINRDDMAATADWFARLLQGRELREADRSHLLASVQDTANPEHAVRSLVSHLLSQPQAFLN